MSDAKIIGVGFHKTGTTSLDHALRILGYSVAGAKIELAQDLIDGNLDKALAYASEFDALQDNPWALLYKELDQAFPKSKFILTTRDEDKWYQSCLKHFGSESTLMREWIYGKDMGMPEGNKQVYIKRFRSHNTEVRTYFENRPHDLLEVNWSNCDGWHKLCEFIGVAKPNIPFPHANRAKPRYTKYKINRIEKLNNRIKKFLK